MESDLKTNFIQETLAGTVDAARAGAFNSWPIHEHLNKMFLFVIAKKIRTIVEFGVEFGASTATFLHALGVSGGSLISYDIHRKENVDSLMEMVPDGVEFEFVLESSLDADFVTCDLLFIDSFHEYNHIKKELEL